MDDRKNSKLNMAQRVSDTLKRYESVYETFAPVVSTVAELNTCIENIRKSQQEHREVNIPAATLTKQEAEAQMIERCVKTARVLYTIGIKTNNKDLITLYGLSDSRFYRLTDNEELALARQILDLSRKHTVDLEKYGINTLELDATETSIENFHTLMSKPMDTIGERKQKTTNIAQLFAELDTIFYDDLDKIMVIFKKSNPDFYDEYRTARNIINTAVRKPKE